MDVLTTRFIRLLEELRVEFAAAHGGSDHGWKTAVGKRMDLSQPFISQVWGGKRSVAKTTVEKAIVAYQLDPVVFYGEDSSVAKRRDARRADSEEYVRLAGLAQRVIAASLAGGDVEASRELAAAVLEQEIWGLAKSVAAGKGGQRAQMNLAMAVCELLAAPFQADSNEAR